MAITADGKITLNRERLKCLRRKLGISQEQLAFQCAERGLCVSVASIKRAETSKNILYRTARDISRFYQLEVEELVSAEASSSSAVVPDFAVNRQIVLLRCGWPADSVAQVATSEFIVGIADLSKQCRADPIQSLPNDHWFAFGTEGINGTEAWRAGYFAQKVQQRATEHDLAAPLCLLVSVTVSSEQGGAALSDQSHPLLQHPVGILAEHIAPGAIIIDDPLQPQLEHHFSTKLLTQSLLPALWQLLPKPGLQHPALSLAGRRVELMQFCAIMDSSTSFSCAHIICLSGVAGIGKSRLLKEFCHLATAAGVEPHLANILDFGDHRAHQLIPQLTNTLLGQTTNAVSREASLTTLAKQLEILDELPILQTMLGWSLNSEGSQLLAAMSHAALAEQQVVLVAKLMAHRASQQPLLIAIEDLHWADDATRQFLFRLLQSITDLPVILVLSYRPEANIDTALQHANASLATTTINLSPLDSSAAQMLADQFNDVTADYRQQCIAKSQGNPLFLEYLLRDSGRGESSQLPYSLQSLVLSRLERLAVQERDAVIAAAVIGQRFSLDILNKVLQQPDYDPQPLVDEFLVAPRGETYLFNHALIREGIYQSIIARDLQRLHQRCADVLLDQDLPVAIKHLNCAQSEQIAFHLIPAIASAANTFQYDSALALIEIGRQVDYTTINRVSLLVWHAEILAKLGDISRSVTVAAEAAQISASPEQKIQSLLLQANGLNTLDDFPAALRAIDAAEAIAIQGRLLAQLAKIYHLKGNFHFPRGDVDACINYHEKSLTFAKKIDAPDLEASALGGLGDAAYAQGKMYSAYDYLRRCLQLCQQHGLQHIEAPNLFMLGTVRIYQNQQVQALEDTLRAIRLAQRVGHKRAEVVAGLTAGWIYLDALQLSQAEKQIAAGIALAQEIGAQRFIPFLEESQARLAFYQGSHAQAQAIIAAALVKMKALKAQGFIGPWLLGTQALVTDDIALGESALAQGQQMLDEGCIGHNYFRFHVAAMEFGIHHQRPDIVTRHRQALQHFTATEPTPWSDFYINRASVLLDTQHNKRLDGGQRQKLLKQGRKAGLITALTTLEEAAINS